MGPDHQGWGQKKGEQKMISIGPCKKCGEELFWDEDENRIDNPTSLLPVCCVHESQYLEKLKKILLDLGASIDPQGYDGGDYEEAIKEILELRK